MWQAICVICIIIVIGMLFFCFRQSKEIKVYKWQKLKYEKQVDFFHLQAKEREAAFKEMHQFRHNFKNHLICLKEYVEQDNKEKIREYVDTLLLDFKGGYYDHRSGNLVVDAVIGYKLGEMKNKEITFETQFSIPEELPFEETDLCVILGNTLDNAIEAAKKMPAGQRMVGLKIEYHPGSLFIVVRNTYTGEIRTDRRGKLLTTKEQKQEHGIGVRSVEHIVRGYQGIITIEPENGIFEFRILLYEQ